MTTCNHKRSYEPGDVYALCDACNHAWPQPIPRAPLDTPMPVDIKALKYAVDDIKGELADLKNQVAQLNRQVNEVVDRINFIIQKLI